eukprot:TRINITY_DN8399_c0_g1_i1.p1 TRINITY_DN8399_c0_g1~~TRINITY_DN8399_c0_g1_i1.p1  ORF type:complete len:749 (-),score=147.33 TRINITY_DN8399_c0_g1_i1:91-2022(-)
MGGSASDYYAVNFLIYTLFCIISAILAAACVQYISPHAAGSGIPEMKSILSGVVMHKFLSMRTLIAKVLTSIFAVVSGLSVGKEGPFVHIAAMVAKNLTRLKPFRGLWTNEMLRAQVLAAGCAAGISATFGTPIGGVLFSIEVTSTYYLVQNYWRGFFCAVCGALMVHLIGGTRELGLFNTQFQQLSYSPLELFAFSILGVLCGLIGALWIENLKHVNLFRQRYAWFRNSRYMQVVAVALLTALIAYPVEFLRGGQKVSINRLFTENTVRAAWEWDPTSTFLNLCIFIIFKYFFSMVSVGLPVGAGMFMPVFALGAGVGRLFGEIVHLIFPSIGVVAGGYAVVGAAGLASGATRAFSTAVIVFELTGQMTHMLPVLIAVLLATAVGNLFNDSVYDTMLSLRHLPYLPALKTGAYGQMANNIMEKVDTEKLATADMSYSQLFSLLNRISNSDRPIPLVKDLSSMQLLGTVQRNHLERLFDHLGYSTERYFAGRTPVAARSFALSNEPPPSATRALHDEARQRTLSSPPESLPTTVSDVTSPRSPKQKLIAAVHAVSAFITPARRPQFRQATADQALADDFLDQPIDILSSCPVERAPVQLSMYTPVPRLHLLFVMLGLKLILIVSGGRLVGIVGREALMEGKLE